MPTTKELMNKIVSGNPSEIHEVAISLLDQKAETYLQETRKQLTAKIFGQPFEISEKVQREPWTKESIREGLQRVVDNQDLKKNLTEDKIHGDIARKFGYHHSELSSTFHSKKDGGIETRPVSIYKSGPHVDPTSELRIYHKHGTFHHFGLKPEFNVNKKGSLDNLHKHLQNVHSTEGH